MITKKRMLLTYAWKKIPISSTVKLSIYQTLFSEILTPFLKLSYAFKLIVVRLAILFKNYYCSLNYKTCYNLEQKYAIVISNSRKILKSAFKTSEDFFLSKSKEESIKLILK